MPLRPRYSKIERMVGDLLDRARITKPAVDVEKLARLVGAEIKLSDFDEDISGVLVREGEIAVIGVQRSQSPVRQRFTIAHELGHFLLHQGESIRVDREFRVNWRRSASPDVRDIEEIEANSFAANLLMPRFMLEKAHGSTTFEFEDETEIERLASLFQVSKQAMNFRLNQLFGRSTFA